MMFIVSLIVNNIGAKKALIVAGLSITIGLQDLD